MKKVNIIIVVVGLLIFGLGQGYYVTITKNSERKIRQNLQEAKRIYESIPIWHKKIKTDQILKVGLITDTHVHPKRINRQDERDEAPRYLSEKYISPLNNFVSQMEKFKPEAIVHLGDVIEGTNDEDFVGIKGIKLVKKEIDRVKVPIYWVIGNHDLRSVTKAQFRETLNLESLDQVIDVGDYRFVILDTNYNIENLPRSPEGNRYIPGKMPPQTIEWLKKHLETNKRVFVFVHHGVFADPSQGDENRTKQSMINAGEIRDILEEYRVDAVFNGHMEARRYEKTRFTSFYSLTGTKKSKTYPESFYEMTISGGVPDVQMFYSNQEHTEILQSDFESCADVVACGDKRSKDE